MEKKNTHVIMFSGGASSAYVAKWVIDRYGKKDCILFFTDTMWEDEDNHRFMEECAEYLGLEITRRCAGLTPEDIYMEQKFLGNARTAKCSEVLKVRQTLLFCEEIRKENKEPILYFGIGPHEAHRAESLKSHYEHLPLEPIKTSFPMLDSDNIEEKARYIIENEWKIELPRMYKLGFSHANCSGRCCRAGLHHYANLYRIWPERFKLQEEMEERFRSTYNLDVSMLKKEGKPYTLERYRKEVLENMSEKELELYSLKEDEETIPCFCSFS